MYVLMKFTGSYIKRVYSCLFKKHLVVTSATAAGCKILTTGTDTAYACLHIKSTLYDGGDFSTGAGGG